jgi:hypothetical protein
MKKKCWICIWLMPSETKPCLLEKNNNKSKYCDDFRLSTHLLIFNLAPIVIFVLAILFFIYLSKQ